MGFERFGSTSRTRGRTSVSQDQIYRKAVGVPFPLAELKERGRAGDAVAK